MNEIWALISLAGEPEIWLLAAGILVAFYFILRKKWEKPGLLKTFLVLLIPSLLLTFGATYVLKLGFDIPRSCTACPAEECNPYCPEDSSFPSGHAATIFTGFTSLSLALRKKWPLLLFVIPVLVSLSRLFLGVHTVMDIMGGAVLGVAVAFAVFWIEKRL